MNRIEDRSTYEVDTDLVGQRYNAVLYLTNRQASWVTVSIIVILFFMFITGYFLGQKKIVKQQSNVELYQKESTGSLTLETEVESPFMAALKNDMKKNKQYYAQLTGFGTLRAADRFVDKLQQKNILVKIVERHSKTAQGKEIVWYQIITDTFNRKDDLIAFTQRIEREECLNDVRIVSC